MTFAPLNALEHIRSHLGLYFPGGHPSPAHIANRLVGDALILGARRTLVVHDGEWWIVAADIDWLGSSGMDLPRLFTSIVSFPEAGENSMRSEVLLGAFAEDIVTWTNDFQDRTLLRGPVHAARDIPRPPGNLPWSRVLTFRLETARMTSHAEASMVATLP